jgi:ubiquinone/menaquinone biosynthesis C-methylase UbiE
MSGGTGGGAALTEPAEFMPLNLSFASNRILSAAVQLGFFPAIAAGRHTVDDIAAGAGANPRGTRMLLDALTAMGLLVKTAGSYALAPLTERHLLPQGADYVGAIFETDAMWNAWGRLAEAVRSGRPAAAVDSEANAAAFFPRLVRSLHVANLAAARRAARVLTEDPASGPAILDVGCGSGVWGIAAAEADPKARLALLDLPEILDDVTRPTVARHELADRSSFLPGSYHEIDLGEGRYDLAFLGNVVHIEAPSVATGLFVRLFRALRPGGRLAIIDMIPNDERSAPFPALMFALNMLIHTAAGDTYTLAEYRTWLTAAGFTRVETCEIGHHSPMIVAAR